MNADEDTIKTERWISTQFCSDRVFSAFIVRLLFGYFFPNLIARMRVASCVPSALSLSGGTRTVIAI